jgi:MFS family permease
MTEFKPADNLRSRTFIGLLVAQFLAAFNDQAIHASAMFYAINQQTMTDRAAISLMPILFYAPWAIFCTLAGYLADRFSKRHSLVFWKIAEVGITLIALAGFWIGRHGHADLGSYLVLSTVFLMGMHSAFFVPAKYGAMPEILTDRMLSRGNGILESLSFLAVILGTVVGGVLSTQFRGEEYVIGIILVVLAVIGAVGSFFIRRMPAANPTRSFPPYLYKPLFESIRGLLRSRPLVVAIVGIAFFTFLVAFMRATVYMHGQTQVPSWSESKTSEIVGMVALGIGLGSPLVGFLSGGKVELGLVPVGAVGMVVATTVAALALNNVPLLIVCIIFIGFFTGFYLVPLFTLLQHRAPKTSKGDAIATSNFINVTGAIVASLVFFGLTYLATHTSVAPALPESAPAVTGTVDEKPEYKEGRPHRIVVGGHVFEASKEPYAKLILRRAPEVGTEVVVRTYQLEQATYYRFQLPDETPRPLHNRKNLPRLLFLGAGFMTLVTLLLLLRQLPDLFGRTLLWCRAVTRYRLEMGGMQHLPGNGPVLLVTDAPPGEPCQHVLSGTDRATCFLELPPDTDAAAWEETIRQGRKLLKDGEVAGISLGGGEPSQRVDQVLEQLTGVPPTTPVLPVHYRMIESVMRKRVYILAEEPLPPETSPAAIRAEVERLGKELSEILEKGLPLDHVAGGGH